MPVSSSTHVDLGPSHGVRLVRQRVPMRDGVGLNAAVYVQRAAKAKVPTVAELTPYSIETAHGEGQYFPGRGFAYVVADVRGRGDSEGQFLPWLCDAQDGDDLIEWITGLPSSRGVTAAWCSTVAPTRTATWRRWGGAPTVAAL